MTAEDSIRFRLRAAYGVRMLGAGCVLLAIAVACWVIRSLAPHPLLTALAATVTALGVLVLAGGAIIAAARPTLLRLDAEGLHNRTGRAAGTRTVAWTDVTDIAWSEASDLSSADPSERGAPTGHTLVLRLTDGRTSRVHVGLLDAGEVAVENAVRTRADAAHGYHPF